VFSVTSEGREGCGTHLYHIENMNIRTMEIAERTTVAEIMYRNARKYPKKEAIVFKDKRLTFRELDELSNQVANFVVGLGVKKGDRVAILMRNSEKFPAVYFGVLKAGAVIICINISFMKPEVKYILEDSGAKLLIFDEFFGPVVEGEDKEMLRLLNEIYALTPEERRDVMDYIMFIRWRRYKGGNQ
jgi:acyl-CoA synthetase (AMP-forming)/AMP-acid ligase II